MVVMASGCGETKREGEDEGVGGVIEGSVGRQRVARGACGASIVDRRWKDGGQE